MYAFTRLPGRLTPPRLRGILALHTLDWSRSAAVERTPVKVSGAWVFKGTREPVKALFENLEDGAQGG